MVTKSTASAPNKLHSRTGATLARLREVHHGPGGAALLVERPAVRRVAPGGDHSSTLLGLPDHARQLGDELVAVLRILVVVVERLVVAAPPVERIGGAAER